MDIDKQIAAALCFPKPQYTSVERERRWICREVPLERVTHTEAITDLPFPDSMRIWQRLNSKLYVHEKEQKAAKAAVRAT